MTFTAGEIANMQAIDAEKTISAAMPVSVGLPLGAPLWSVERPADSQGYEDDGDPEPAENVIAYIARRRQDTMQAAAPGVLVPVGPWVLYAEADQDIRSGDTLTNIAESHWRFTVADLDSDGRVLTGTATPVE